MNRKKTYFVMFCTTVQPPTNHSVTRSSLIPRLSAALEAALTGSQVAVGPGCRSLQAGAKPEIVAPNGATWSDMERLGSKPSFGMNN